MNPRSKPKLDHAFYRRPAADLAEDLIGKILVRRYRGKEYRTRIVETEAYVGPEDLACHSAKGRTARTEIMFGPGGHTYVYLIYGMHQMLNLTCGEAQAVLLRAAEPLDGWQADLSGPGKLARALHIRRCDNGLDLTGDQLFVLDVPGPRPRIARTRRVGVEYAGKWKDKLLRFFDADSAAVSKRPRDGGLISPLKREG